MGTRKNHFDFIKITNTWKTSVLNCKTYPGADCDSDHQLLVATVKIRLHGKKHQFVVTPLNLEELRNEKATRYEIEVSNRFDALGAVQEEMVCKGLSVTLVYQSNTGRNASRRILGSESWNRPGLINQSPPCPPSRGADR